MNYLAGIHVLLVLLPGFVTAWIVSSLTVTQARTELDKIIEALVYSFVVYAVCVLIFGFPQLGTLLAQETPDSSLVERAKWYLLASLVLSILLGVAISWLITSDALTNRLRAYGVTARSSRASVWSDVFHTVDGYVIVEFADGRRLRGWPQHFSDTPEEGSLFLVQASWIQDDGTPIDVKGPGILITKNLPIQTIMFVSGVPKDAAASV